MADTEQLVGTHLFGLLRELENRCLAQALGLPQQPAPEPTWEGIVFSLARQPLVTPLGEVKEILNYPAVLTHVPGAQAWVAGIANIRGNLLPIVDLQAFLLQQRTVAGRRNRVLVIDHAGVYSGLLVDAWVGIRHFSPTEQIPRPAERTDAIWQFVDAVYQQQGMVWPVFSLCRLAASPEFRSAAA